MHLLSFINIFRFCGSTENPLKEFFNPPNITYDVSFASMGLICNDDPSLEKRCHLLVECENKEVIHLHPFHYIKSISYNDMELGFISISLYSKSIMGLKHSVEMTGTLDLSKINKGLKQSEVLVPLYRSKTLGECINLYNVKADGYLRFKVNVTVEKVYRSMNVADELEYKKNKFIEQIGGEDRLKDKITKHFMGIFMNKIPLTSLLSYSSAIKMMRGYIRHESAYSPITDEIKEDGYFAAVSALSYRAQLEHLACKNKNLKRMDNTSKIYLEQLGRLITKKEFKIINYFPQKKFRPGFLAVEKDKDTIVIGIKGTSTFEEFFACILYDYVYSNGHLLHEGHLKLMEIFMKKYWKIYLGLIKNYKKVYLTGHSLGGSLATLLHYISQMKGLSTSERKIETVTFAPLPCISLPNTSQVQDIRNYTYGEDVVSWMSGGMLKNVKLLLKSLVNNYIAHSPLIGWNPLDFNQIVDFTMKCINKKYNHVSLKPLGKTIRLRSFNAEVDTEEYLHNKMYRELSEEDLLFPYFSKDVVTGHGIKGMLKAIYEHELPDEIVDITKDERIFTV